MLQNDTKVCFTFFFLNTVMFHVEATVLYFLRRSTVEISREKQNFTWHFFFFFLRGLHAAQLRFTFVDERKGPDASISSRSRGPVHEKAL